jgi:hypothetical protein
MLLTMFISSQVCANELRLLADSSREIISNFSILLKKELQAAIQEGGPVNAITVCKTRAPDIAENISREGWQVGRTSLKIRNPANAPDEFEQNVLEDFERRKNEGRDIEQLAYYKMTEVGEQSEFRYVKAIATGDLCLTCHGTNIAEQIVIKLDQLYPGDKARGYKKGDIRGAFTLRKIFQRKMEDDTPRRESASHH